MSVYDDAARALIGTAMFAPQIIEPLTAEEGVRVEDFPVGLRAVMAAIVAVHDNGGQVTQTTVQHRLDAPHVAALGHCIVGAGEIAAWRDHARLVLEGAEWERRRQTLVVLSDAVRRQDHEEWATVEHALLNRPDRDPDAVWTPERLAAAAVAFLDGDAAQPLPLPWDGLNGGLGGGLRPGDTTVLAGWTSMGKSVVAAQILEHASDNGKTAALLTNEMHPMEFALRLVAGRANVPFPLLLDPTRTLGAHQDARVRSELARLPFPVVDIGGRPVEDVCRRIRRGGWDIAVLDLFNALQFHGRDGVTAESERAIYALRDAARHASTHLIIVCQLNRERDVQAKAPPPTLRDLRMGGHMEHAPANVMFIHRDQDLDDTTGIVKRKNDATLYFRKARNGNADNATRVVLVPDRMRYEPLDLWRRPDLEAVA